MSTAEINGLPCSRVRVQIPSWGVWWADVDVVGDQAISGAATLTVGSMTLVGTVVVGGTASGRSAYRIAGGAARWGHEISARSYANDLGVRRTVLAQDAATDAGETVDVSTLVGTVGPSYVRDVAPASRVLDAIAPSEWYVDVDGVTRFGARVAAPLTTTAPRVIVSPLDGMIVLSPDADEVSSYVPGVVVDGAQAVDVQIDVGTEGLRVSMYTSPWGLSRRARAMRALVRQYVPEARWNGVYEYRVGLVEAGGERLALQPVRTVRGLPDLRYVRVRPGVFGARSTPMLGALCLVGFVDADPTRPVVLAGDDADAPGHLPDDADYDATDAVRVGAHATMTSIGPEPRKAMARLGDAVTCGPFAGTITTASTTTEAG